MSETILDYDILSKIQELNVTELTYEEWVIKFADEIQSYLPPVDRGEVTQDTVKACVLGDLASLGLDPVYCAKTMIIGLIMKDNDLNEGEAREHLDYCKKVYSKEYGL